MVRLRLEMDVCGAEKLDERDMGSWEELGKYDGEEFSEGTETFRGTLFSAKYQSAFFCNNSELQF